MPFIDPQRRRDYDRARDRKDYFKNYMRAYRAQRKEREGPLDFLSDTQVSHVSVEAVSADDETGTKRVAKATYRAWYLAQW